MLIGVTCPTSVVYVLRENYSTIYLSNSMCVCGALVMFFLACHRNYSRPAFRIIIFS